MITHVHLPVAEYGDDTDITGWHCALCGEPCKARLATSSLIDAERLAEAVGEYDRSGWLSGDMSEAFRARWIAAEYFRSGAREPSPLGISLRAAVTEYLATDGSEGQYDAHRMIVARNLIYRALGRPEMVDATHDEHP